MMELELEVGLLKWKWMYCKHFTKYWTVLDWAGS